MFQMIQANSHLPAPKLKFEKDSVEDLEVYKSVFVVDASPALATE